MEQFTSNATINDSQEIADFVFSSEDAPLFQEEEHNLKTRILLEKQKLESFRIQTILGIWKEQQDAERKLRKNYANYFIWILIFQLIIVSTIFILVGCSVLKYKQWVVHIFIISVFGEIIGLVSIIVRYLFTSTSKEMIDLVKEQSHF
jgi:amino acid transporter